MQQVEKTIQLLEARIIQKRIPIDGIYRKECSYKKGSILPPVDSTWEPFNNGSQWGEKRDTHCWFFTKVKVPQELRKGNVRISVKTDKKGWDAENPQFLAYIDGECIQGLDLNHTSITLPKNEEFELYLYAYSGTPATDGNNDKFASTLEIAFEIVDEAVQSLYYDISVPADIAKYLEIDSAQYAELSAILHEACDCLRFFGVTDEVYRASIEKAAVYLQEKLYSKAWNTDDIKIACIGHTHIDIAWKWTIAQAREKAQRSFATEVALLKKNDDFRFMSSQAYLYEAVKEECPQLYEEIRQLVKAKKWEVEGAAWLEFDANVPCGESLVRQIVYGKKFFQEEFGVDTKVLWLPDVFGYSAALPQILKKAGVDKFVTSKISWNDTNRLPNDMFNWKGIDGSEVLAYFISTTPKRRGLPVICGTGYVSFASPADIAGTYERFNPKNIASELLCCYGHGDGGGGVTQGMIEKVRRMSKGLPGCPTTEMKTVTQAFEDMQRKNEGKVIPSWVGELYLEFHRGTYTTRALNKKYNRLCEEELKRAEWLCTLAHVEYGAEYPQERLERLWKEVLLYQFHDILPGSSIREVYEDTDIGYERVLSEVKMIISEATEAIVKDIKADEFISLNPTSLEINGIPSKGYKIMSTPEVQGLTTIHSTENIIENKWYKVVFNTSGQIEELIYKPQNRSVLKSNAKGNVLMAYEDMPLEYDAWNIDADYIQKGTEVDCLLSKESIHEKERSGYCFQWKLGDSIIKQTIWLYENIDRIDFDTEVDWQAEHILLKALFPVEVNTDHAVYEIQFGTVSRSTHNNTSWDEAQFEVPAQRFCYLKENGFGVALLNDCKYGYAAKNNVMSLSLLRSTADPFQWADKGKHSFKYSIYCGGDNFEVKTLKHAEQINKPMSILKGTGEVTQKTEYSLVSCDAENVVIDTVKLAENGKDIVIRMYEATNRRTNCVLSFGFAVKDVWKADLMENEQEKLRVRENKMNLQVNPFEIVTLVIKRE